MRRWALGSSGGSRQRSRATTELRLPSAQDDPATPCPSARLVQSEFRMYWLLGLRRKVAHMSKYLVALDFQTDFLPPRQILAGFLLLEEQGAIELNLTYGKTMHDRHPDRALVRATVDGCAVAFDVNDGYWYDQQSTERLLTEVDVLFKRSWDPATHGAWRGGDRIRPLGFNYHAETRHRVFRDLDMADPKGYIRSRGRLVLRRGVRPLVEFYEVEPRFNPEPAALFYSRLWDPLGESPQTELPAEDAEHRVALNAVRADCVRLLRDNYGPRFAGGLEPTPYALTHHPELVKDRSKTSKRAYLAQVRTTEICVCSLGLSDANGWRVGEYLAASRAIVNERMRYLVPGGFTEGTNFREFTTADQCVRIVGELLEDPDTVYAMQVANHAYYLDWLRPDRLIWHALESLTGG